MYAVSGKVKPEARPGRGGGSSRSTVFRMPGAAAAYGSSFHRRHGDATVRTTEDLYSINFM